MTEEKLQIQPFGIDELEGADMYVSIEKSNIKLAVVNRVRQYANAVNLSVASASSLQRMLPFNIQDLNRCRKVSISLATDRFVLVPASFFDTRVAKEYLYQAYEIDPNEKVRYKLIKSMNAFMVYQHDEFINQLTGFFPKTEIVIPEIDAFVQFIHRSKDRNDLYLHFYNRAFMLYLVVDNAVHLVQYFTFVEATDAVYFILNVLDSFGVNPAEAKAVISGNVMPYSELFNSIYRFIGEIEWFSAPESPINTGNTLIENNHTIADLHCLALCV